MDDNRLVLNYPDTSTDESGDYMSEQNWRKQVQISLSENQIDATDKAAAEMGMKRSEFIRYALSQVVKNFPDDLPAQGENLKRKVS